MAELVDAPASGAGARKGVEVRVLFWAPLLFYSVVTDWRPRAYRALATLIEAWVQQREGRTGRALAPRKRGPKPKLISKLAP